MVEVLVALTLLGVTMVALFGLMRACAAAAHHSHLVTQSVCLAERLLAEMGLQEHPAFESAEGSEGSYTWRTRIAPTPVENLGAIHVRVNWTEQGRIQQYDLFTLVCMGSFGERYE